MYVGLQQWTTIQWIASEGQRRPTTVVRMSSGKAVGGARDTTRLEPQVCFHFVPILFSDEHGYGCPHRFAGMGLAGMGAGEYFFTRWQTHIRELGLWVCFKRSLKFLVSVRLKTNAGLRQPTKAHTGQRRPTKTNEATAASRESG